MIGIFIALISGALMSVQGVFNTEVTKASSVWVSASWVQFSALLRDGLYLELAANANRMAAALAQGLRGLDLPPRFTPESNMVFLALPRETAKALEASVAFEYQEALDEDTVPEGAGVTCRCPRFVEDTELKQRILEEEAFERAYGEEYMQMRLAALRRDRDATH